MINILKQPNEQPNDQTDMSNETTNMSKEGVGRTFIEATRFM